KRVLKLDEPQDVVLEIDHRRRGIRLHDLMKRLHARINDELGRNAVPGEVDEPGLFKLIDELIAAIGRGDEHPLAEAFDEIDRTLFRRWLGEYAGQHVGYEKSYGKLGGVAKPRHFEVSFGL